MDNHDHVANSQWWRTRINEHGFKWSTLLIIEMFHDVISLYYFGSDLWRRGQPWQKDLAALWVRRGGRGPFLCRKDQLHTTSFNQRTISSFTPMIYCTTTINVMDAETPNVSAIFRESRLNSTKYIVPSMQLYQHFRLSTSCRLVRSYQLLFSWFNMLDQHQPTKAPDPLGYQPASQPINYPNPTNQPNLVAVAPFLMVLLVINGH